MAFDFLPETYGAVGDGTTDDRAAIQSAINAAAAEPGGRVLFSGKTYAVGQNSTNPYCLQVPASVRLEGVGMNVSVLRQTPSIAVNVRLLFLDNADFTEIKYLCLDGNKSNQTVNEQRHGMFIENTQHALFYRVQMRNFTGDGAAVYLNCQHVAFDRCLVTGNDRNGISLLGYGDNVNVNKCNVYGNAAQQIDTETGVVGNNFHNTKIDGNYVAATPSNDYAITLGGSSAAFPATGYSVIGNTVHGPIRVIYGHDGVVVGNHGINPTEKTHVEIYRTTERAVVVGNALHNTQTTTPAVPTVWVLGTTGEMPDNVIVAANSIANMGHHNCYGIIAQTTKQTNIIGNNIIGVGGSVQAFSAGILARSTEPTIVGRGVMINGNYIKNFGNIGISVAGNGASRTHRIMGVANMFDDDNNGTMTVGIDMDAPPILYPFHAQGWSMNMFLGGCTTEFRTTNKVVPVLVGGNEGLGAKYGFPNTKG